MPKPSTEDPAKERTPSYRETQLDQINAARRDFLVDEGFKAEDIAPEPEPAAATAAADPEPAPAAADAPAADPAPAAPEEKFDVNVDGKTMQVTRQELLEGYQIASTARNRLEVATGILRNAKKIAGTDAGGEGAGTAADGSPPAATKPADAPPEPDYVALTKSIQFDDPEASGKAMKEIFDQNYARAVELAKQNSAPPPDPALIAQRVLDKIEWDNSVINLATHHSDILSVPELTEMAGGIAKRAFDADMAKIKETGQGNRRPFQEYFEQGIERVRAVTGIAKPVAADGTKDSPAAPNGTPKNGNGQQQQTTVDLDPSRVTLKRALPSQPTPRRAASPGAAQQQPVEFTESADLARRQSAISEITAARRPRARA